MRHGWVGMPAYMYIGSICSAASSEKADFGFPVIESILVRTCTPYIVSHYCNVCNPLQSKVGATHS